MKHLIRLLSTKVGSLFRMGADIAAYFVDLSPLDVSIFVGKTAKESVAADGSAHVTAAAGRRRPAFKVHRRPPARSDGLKSPVRLPQLPLIRGSGWT
jgi:hypothetical protein